MEFTFSQSLTFISSDLPILKVTSSHGTIELLAHLLNSQTYAAVTNQALSPSWQNALNFHESKTKLNHAFEAYKPIYTKKKIQKHTLLTNKINYMSIQF